MAVGPVASPSTRSPFRARLSLTAINLRRPSSSKWLYSSVGLDRVCEIQDLARGTLGVDEKAVAHMMPGRHQFPYTRKGQ